MQACPYDAIYIDEDTQHRGEVQLLRAPRRRRPRAGLRRRLPDALDLGRRPRRPEPRASPADRRQRDHRPRAGAGHRARTCSTSAPTAPCSTRSRHRSRTPTCGRSPTSTGSRRRPDITGVDPHARARRSTPRTRGRGAGGSSPTCGRRASAPGRCSSPRSRPARRRPGRAAGDVVAPADRGWSARRPPVSCWSWDLKRPERFLYLLHPSRNHDVLAGLGRLRCSASAGRGRRVVRSPRRSATTVSAPWLALRWPCPAAALAAGYTGVPVRRRPRAATSGSRAGCSRTCWSRPSWSAPVRWPWPWSQPTPASDATALVARTPRRRHAVLHRRPSPPSSSSGRHDTDGAAVAARIDHRAAATPRLFWTGAVALGRGCGLAGASWRGTARAGAAARRRVCSPRSPCSPTRPSTSAPARTSRCHEAPDE